MYFNFYRKNYYLLIWSFFIILGVFICGIFVTRSLVSYSQDEIVEENEAVLLSVRRFIEHELHQVRHVAKVYRML